jgi:hypothetical protein
LRKRAAAKPLIPGIDMSISTTSGRCSSALRTHGLRRKLRRLSRCQPVIGGGGKYHGELLRCRQRQAREESGSEYL